MCVDPDVLNEGRAAATVATSAVSSHGLADATTTTAPAFYASTALSRTKGFALEKQPGNCDAAAAAAAAATDAAIPVVAAVPAPDKNLCRTLPHGARKTSAIRVNDKARGDKASPRSQETKRKRASLDSGGRESASPVMAPPRADEERQDGGHTDEDLPNQHRDRRMHGKLRMRGGGYDCSYEALGTVVASLNDHGQCGGRGGGGKFEGQRLPSSRHHCGSLSHAPHERHQSDCSMNSSVNSACEHCELFALQELNCLHDAGSQLGAVMDSDSRQARNAVSDLHFSHDSDLPTQHQHQRGSFAVRPLTQPAREPVQQHSTVNTSRQIVDPAWNTISPVPLDHQFMFTGASRLLPSAAEVMKAEPSTRPTTHDDTHTYRCIVHLSTSRMCSCELTTNEVDECEG